MPPVEPLDPSVGGKLALAGRIVTMNATREVIADGVLYIDAGGIVSVQLRNAPPPAGFETTPVKPVGGTMFPGLFELHNHLAYNALPLWMVPKTYENRDQWGSKGEPKIYRKAVSGPMKVLGRDSHLPAVVRYVEVKAMVGGTTTSQGIELYSNARASRYYRGLVRNVEQTLDKKNLPHAATKIGDVTDAKAFAKQLARTKGSFILHLAEGVGTARKHFTGLKLDGSKWALGKNLVGIHCVALEPEDFDVLASFGAKMVWSPLSNLLLYGQTANIKAARAAGVLVTLGSDWSVSGSKSLFGELKIAHLAAPEIPLAEIVAMGTCNAATAVGWQGALGSLEAGKRADLFVVRGKTGDAYDGLLKSTENDIELVMINGVPRVGTAPLMAALGLAGGESLTIGGRKRLLNLTQAQADPDVAHWTYAQAVLHLDDAMGRLAELAKTPDAAPVPGKKMWALKLDEDDEAIRVPRKRRFAPAVPDAAAAEPLWKILEPIVRDPLTVADHEGYVATMKKQMNLPAAIKSGLAALYT